MWVPPYRSTTLVLALVSAVSAYEIDPGTFEGVDAVVNLNGAGVADRPWSGARRQLLRDSRVVPTEVLATAVAEHRIPALLNGSAVG